MKTAVIYWSGTGNTEAMARAVAEGMTAAGAEAAVQITLSQTRLKLQAALPKAQPRRQARGAVRLLRLGRRRVDAHLGE